MMLVAVLTLATVASVQAADVKVEIKERDANQNLVAAQNIKYSVVNAEGAVVANGETADFSMDVAEGNYELSAEQAADEHVRYGSAALVVPPTGDELVYELTDSGLKLVKEDDDKAGVIVARPVANGVGRLTPVARPVPALPQLPAQVPTTGAFFAGNNWGFLGLTGALVATAIALGVDDDCPCPVTPCQR